jgi:hypothetical protein
VGTAIVIFIIAAFGAMLWWNWKQASQAFGGTEFSIPHPPAAVAAAAAAAFDTRGMKGMAKSMMRRVSVASLSSNTFRYSTSLGDEGTFQIRAGENGSSLVVAKTEQLFRGAKQKNAKSGFYQLVFALNGVLMKTLRVRPNAGRMLRFQRDLQGRIEKQIAKSAAG